MEAQWTVYAANHDVYAILKSPPVDESYVRLAGPFTWGEAHSWMLDNVIVPGKVNRQPLRWLSGLFQSLHHLFG